MTLNELVDSVSQLKGWKTVSDQGVVSLAIPQAGNRKQLIAVSEFKDEGQAMVRFTTRIGQADQLDAARRLRPPWRMGKPRPAAQAPRRCCRTKR